MDTLGQDRMRSLLINYRRNKIKLAILISIFTVLLLWTAFLFLRIESIKNRVAEEYAPYIEQAYSEMHAAEAVRSEMSAHLEELRSLKKDLETRIEQADIAN